MVMNGNDDQIDLTPGSPPDGGVWQGSSLSDIFTPVEERAAHPFDPWYGNLNKITSVPFRTPVDPVLYVDVPEPANMNSKSRKNFEEQKAVLSRRLTLCSKIGRAQLTAPCNNFTFNLCLWNRSLTLLGEMLEPYGGLDPEKVFVVYPIDLHLEEAAFLTADDEAQINAGLPRIFNESDVTATRMMARRLAARIHASHRIRERALATSCFQDYSQVRRLFRMNDPDGMMHGAKYDLLPPALQEFYTICVQSMGGRMRAHNQAVMARLMESFSNESHGGLLNQRRIQGSDPQALSSSQAAGQALSQAS